MPSPLYGFGLIDPVAALRPKSPRSTSTPLGSLAEWITLHRRATSEAPAPSAETPEIVPIADPPLPDDDATTTLLPTPWTLAYITVPLSLVAGFGTLGALLGIGATRHLRRTVRTREQ